MKKIFRNKRVIAIALLTVFSVAYGQTVLGNDVIKTIPVELKFLGTIKNQMAFQLVFTGDSENNDFAIFIKDIDGLVIYNENIKGENFSKKFLFNTEELGDQTLFFEIMNKKTKNSVVYSIEKTTRQVEEMQIQEL